MAFFSLRTEHVGSIKKLKNMFFFPETSGKRFSIWIQSFSFSVWGWNSWITAFWESLHHMSFIFFNIDMWCPPKRRSQSLYLKRIFLGVSHCIHIYILIYLYICVYSFIHVLINVYPLPSFQKILETLRPDPPLKIAQVWHLRPPMPPRRIGRIEQLPSRKSRQRVSCLGNDRDRGPVD